MFARVEWEARERTEVGPDDRRNAGRSQMRRRNRLSAPEPPRRRALMFDGYDPPARTRVIEWTAMPAEQEAEAVECRRDEPWQPPAVVPVERGPTHDRAERDATHREQRGDSEDGE
jgi:hypothetical protein